MAAAEPELAQLKLTLDSFEERIRFVRTMALHINSVTEMARLIGRSHATVATWEDGARPQDLVAVAEAYSRVCRDHGLDVTAAWFLFGAEYAVITPTLRLITTTAPQMSDSYERIQPERNEGRGPWKASLRILNGARNGDSDPSTCGYSERRSCA